MLISFCVSLLSYMLHTRYNATLHKKSKYELSHIKCSFLFRRCYGSGAVWRATHKSSLSLKLEHGNFHPV